MPQRVECALFSGMGATRPLATSGFLAVHLASRRESFYPLAPVMPQRGDHAFLPRIITAIAGAVRLANTIFLAGRGDTHVRGGSQVMPQRGNRFRFQHLITAVAAQFPFAFILADSG